MLPATHHYFLREAFAAVSPADPGRLSAFLVGNDDEDVLIVPVLGFRLRAAGFTHTQRPGRNRGELGFPNAAARCRTYIAQAKRESDPGRVWYWFGRIGHLIGDAAVPARARGVWHWEGDPLEAWIEARIKTRIWGEAPLIPEEPPEVLVKELAEIAAGFEADTTRTPWGRITRKWLGGGVVLDEETLEKQAEVLVPAAVGYLRAFLGWARTMRAPPRVS